MKTKPKTGLKLVEKSTEATFDMIGTVTKEVEEEAKRLGTLLSQLAKGQNSAMQKGFMRDVAQVEKVIDDTFEKSGTEFYRKRVRTSAMLKALQLPDFAASVGHRSRLISSLGHRLQVRPDILAETYEDDDTSKQEALKVQKKIVKERDKLNQYLFNLPRDRHTKGRIPLATLLHSLALDYVAMGYCCVELLRDKSGTVVRAIHAPAERMIEAKDGTFAMVDSVSGGDSGTKGARYQRYIPYLGTFSPKDPEVKFYLNKKKLFKDEAAKNATAGTPTEINEILMIKHPSLIDRLYGASPIAYSYDATISMGLSMLLNNQQWFANAGVASWAVIISGGVFSKESRRDIEEMLVQMKTQRYKIPVFQSPQKDVKIELHQMNVTPQELSFLETAKMIQQNVLSLTGVPPSKLGVVDGANRSNMKEQNLIMEDEVLGPDRIGFNWFINLLLTEEAKMVLHEFVLKELRSATDLENARQFFTESLCLATTPNEYRAKNGLHPVFWGNRPATTQSQQLTEPIVAMLYPEFVANKPEPGNNGRPATNTGGATSDVQQPPTNDSNDAAIHDSGTGRDNGTS